VSQANLSQEYARAIYALALESWQKVLLAVQTRLDDSPDLVNQLVDTQLPFAERQRKLDAILPAEANDSIRNFLYTLLKNGHLNSLSEIATALTRLATKGPSVEVGLVTTAVPLSDAEKEQFQTKLSESYGDALSLDFTVDESILGGAIVQVGDKIIDGSLVTKLESIREKLMAAV
jgi:F-type H+-transporting ATPase subunit delta